MDGVLLVAVAALAVIGTMLVWSVDQDLGARLHRAWSRSTSSTSASGPCSAGMAAMVDYRRLRAYAPLVYGLSPASGWCLVITPLGSTVNGSHSWIMVGGGFALQPSEFAKVGMVLMLAMLLAEPARRQRSAARPGRLHRAGAGRASPGAW